MKLNEEHPTQHLVILVLGGVFTFLNIVESIKAPSDDKPLGPVKHTYTSVDEMTGEVREIESTRKNPEMTWYEKLFCRGYQRSTACSYRLLHPLKAGWDDAGIVVPESPPEQNHVIRYRGRIETHTSLSGRVEAPD